jgi:hypothetical protein
MAELSDALQRASTDPEFARQFVENPTQFQQEYNLTDEQIQRIKEAAAGDVFGYMMAKGGGGSYY